MGLTKLLAATDFSSRSERALARAAALCGQSSASLHLLHVVDDDRPAETVAQETAAAEAALRSLAGALADKMGATPSYLVMPGDPSEQIVSAAEKYEADLVVLGSHRKRLLQDVFVGTAVERVIRTGHCPVLMVKAEPKGPYRRVIVAVDMSPASARALRLARDLGLLDGVYLTLLHAFEPFAKVMMTYAGIEREAVEDHVARERNTAEQALKDFLAEQDLQGLHYEVRLLEGPVFHSIHKIAEQEKPDLLVIGTRGLTGASRMLLGSVADAVLRDTGCDVLAVPPA